jgi:hypothetical protein
MEVRHMEFEFEMEVDIDIKIGADFDGFAGVLAGGFIRALIGSVIREVLPDDVGVVIVPLAGMVIKIAKIPNQKDSDPGINPANTIPVFVGGVKHYVILPQHDHRQNNKLDCGKMEMDDVGTRIHITSTRTNSPNDVQQSGGLRLC